MKAGPSFQSLRLAMGFVLLCSILFSEISMASAAGVCYVKVGATAPGTGISWEEAYPDLQSALGPSPCTEIWVAAGTYKPTSGTDRKISFVLESGVSIYGGFVGTETTREERNPGYNVTILSGEIGSQDVTTDNSYHVVVASGTTTTAALDGFTITGGNADALVQPDSDGGGIYISYGSPSLSNVIFRNNSAKLNGGGMRSEYGNPSLTNVIFESNHSVTNGGGIANKQSSPTLTYVIFDGNTARYGGGMSNSSHSDSRLRDVIFRNNAAEGIDPLGGGMYNDSSKPSLVNVTFSNNSTVDGGGMFNGNCPIGLSLTNVTFSGNKATGKGGAMINTGSFPSLFNVTFSGNQALSGGGIYNTYSSNPIITNSILYGDAGGEVINDPVHTATATMAYSIVQGGFAGTGNLDANPLLGTLQDNGGFTWTMALSPGSPAIESGNDANCPQSDQRGIQRPQLAHCDIGAYEVPPPRAQSVLRTDPNPTSALAVHFTVRFSESVEFVDLADFKLSTTGAIGAAISEVSGSGDTYAVTASTGTGNGTIRLDLIDDDSIRGASGIPLGGAGPANGNFTTGETYSVKKVMTLSSTAAQDGWILESTETSGAGGKVNAGSATFSLGDSALDQQYRAILSFNTGALPANAVITKVQLKIRKQGLVGTNPFITLGGLKVDIKQGAFSDSTVLQRGDFKALANKSLVATFGKTPSSGWYTATLSSTAYMYLSETNTVQFRLRFTKDDNDDRGADYMSFYSANSSTVNRPKLVVTYYTP